MLGTFKRQKSVCVSAVFFSSDVLYYFKKLKHKEPDNVSQKYR